MACYSLQMSTLRRPFSVRALVLNSRQLLSADCLVACVDKVRGLTDDLAALLLVPLFRLTGGRAKMIGTALLPLQSVFYDSNQQTLYLFRCVALTHGTWKWETSPISFA